MFKNTLLAVDINDPEGAVRSTEAAVSMAQHEGATLHILNVVPDQGMAIVSASMAPDHSAAIQQAAREALATWAAANVPGDVATELHVVQGTVYDQIIKTADSLAAECIIVGAHSPSLKDYLIGPNAARVARHASQSVFVLR
ncbi:MAG: universal stress protein [Rhodobacteraceae bacterium]|nr:universal stress protein [Paracoccaceae bacterium]